MKTLMFFLLFCFACTKIEYITEQAATTGTATDSSKVGETKPAKDTVKKPVKPIDTVIVKKPYTLHDFDGNVYDSVILGTQIWLVENLKTTHYNNGTPIPLIIDRSIWANSLTPAMCWYDNDLTYKNISGGLYNYYCVNTGNICPIGWHVSTDGDWKILEMSMGMSFTVTDSLGWRGKGYAFILESSNFKALFAGFRSAYNGDYGDYSLSTEWWTSSRYDETTAYTRSIEAPSSYVSSYIYRGSATESMGASVRCVKN